VSSEWVRLTMQQQQQHHHHHHHHPHTHHTHLRSRSRSRSSQRPKHYAAEWALLITLVIGLLWVFVRGQVEAARQDTEADVWLGEIEMPELQESFKKNGESHFINFVLALLKYI